MNRTTEWLKHLILLSTLPAWKKQCWPTNLLNCNINDTDGGMEESGLVWPEIPLNAHVAWKVTWMLTPHPPKVLQCNA